MKSIKLLILTIVSVTLTVACTRKRDDKWATQGPKYHATVAAFDGKMFDVVTKEAIAESSNTTVESSVDIQVNEKPDVTEKNLDGNPAVTVADMNAVQSIVKYETKAELAMVKEVVFRGRPMTTDKYQIMYRVTDHRLLVLKVAKKEDMPWYEIPLAYETLEDGRLAYPLLEYPIQHLKLEKSRNSDNEETNLILEIPVLTKEEGTVFKLDTTQFKRPAELTLNETFPMNFFESKDDKKNPEEWYFLTTVVDANSYWESDSGMVLNEDSDGAKASKVFFKRSQTGDALEVRNSDKASQYEGDNQRGSIDNSVVMSIPAEYFDLRLEPDGNEKSITPEMNSDRKVADREFVQLKLAEISKTSQTAEISEITINDGYFSFVIEETKKVYAGYNFWLGLVFTREKRAKVKYSFYKKSQRQKDLAKRGCTEEYIPRVAFSDDFEKFGTFTQRVSTVYNHQYRTQKDFDQLHLMKRHNPKCTVTYHVGKKTKKKYYPHARKMILAWRDTLKKNNVGFDIQFSETPAETGDVRYNTVDIIEPVGEAGWSGIAQTVSDPDTGEVIYSQSQIQAQTMKAGAQISVLKYIREKSGLSDVGYTPNHIHAANPEQAEQFDDMQIELINNYINKLQTNENLMYPMVDFSQIGNATPEDLINEIKAGKSFMERGQAPFYYLTKDSLEKSMQKPVVIPEYNPDGNINSATHSVQKCNLMEAFDGTRGNLDGFIEKFCSVGSEDGSVQSLLSYISVLKKSKQDELVEMDLDKKIIDQCTENLIVGAKINGVYETSDLMIGVGLHEVGHTLSLRHNFKGSADKFNYYTNDDKVTQLATNVESSSVMDYLQLKDLWADIPGKYDIAAIRFVYDGAVELNPGENNPAVKGTIKKIDPNLSLKDQQLSEQMRPFKFCSDMQAYTYSYWDCAIADYGSTPLEIVNNHIEDYKESLANSRLKYDNLFLYGSGAFSRRFMRMSRIYEEWRYELRKAVGVENQYLESFGNDGEAYEKALKQLAAKRPSFKKVYETYYPAVKRIQEFLMDEVALMPDRYCIFAKDGVGQNPRADQVKAIELAKIRQNIGYNDKVVSCSSDAVKRYVADRTDEYGGMKLIKDVGYETWHTFYDRNIFKFSGGDSFSVAPTGTPDIRGTVMDKVSAFITIALRLGLHPISRYEGFYPSMLDEPNLRESIKVALMSRITDGVKLEDKTFKLDGYLSNFENEQRLIEEYYSLFRAGLSIPGDSDSSMVRQEPYDVILTTSDPSSFALAYADLGTFKLAALYHTNTEAIKLLNQILLGEKIVASKGNLEKVELKDLVDLVQLIQKSVPQSNSVRSVSAGELRSFTTSLREMSNASPKLKNIIDVSFSSEMSLVRILDSMGLPDDASFDDLKVSDKVILERIAAFNTESLLSRLQNATEFYTSTLQGYWQNPLEIRKQIGLSKNALLRRSYYRD